MYQYGPRGYRYPIKPSSQYNRTPQEIPPKKPGMKLSWILGIIFILVIAGVASLFLFFSGEENKQDISSNIDKNISAAIVECGNDIDCFIDETYECGLANLTYDFAINLFGWVF
jgi:hypothetical protein